jgi:hypothetical protein
MKRIHGLLLTGLGLAAAACGSASSSATTGGQQVPQGSQSTTTTASSAQQPTGTWKLVTYYTVVESFHSGPPQAVVGCSPGADECNRGTTPLGSFPGDFVSAVREEGTGRITNGPYAGKVLTWDAESGYSIDDAPNDASGSPLKPFVSAATDESVPMGTAFRVQDCGVGTGGGRVDAAVCSRLTAASWVVADRTGKPAGSRELHLYIGVESRPGFATSDPLVVSTVDARTTLR